MALFCKKNFSSRSPSPRKLNKASFPNAFRPDCPTRPFRGQQNSSESSESTEETESAESGSIDPPGVALIRPATVREGTQPPQGAMICYITGSTNRPLYHFPHWCNPRCSVIPSGARNLVLTTTPCVRADYSGRQASLALGMTSQKALPQIPGLHLLGNWYKSRPGKPE